ncbi:phospholipase A2 inhibitor and Ly6/PLAUR domain-containing protein-like [Xenopus laevis]|uniref:Phospholipase A2 inhibitor and Ly6/PLAUR domain-containing protein-like n=2 Tax=Xenopus laevis TaxID=8355 RepID=A0A1L8FPM4_XENLA|nr:phospholipase A2 inhibitor and Ly6/PLAUR domain-containing protein-like [Xenopus laevis]OCT73547.1 hypothetical protein XELAEV_18036526mg [Xenopus laevis]
MIFVLGLLLSVVVSTASSLSCITCSQNNATSCQGSSMLCPIETICGSLSLSMTKDGQTQRNIARGCFQEKQCNQTMIFRITNATGKNIISCCSSDDCTPPVLQLPDDNNLPNGMTCPTCFSDQSNDCIVSGTINCAGTETQCASVKLSGPLTGTVSFQGCANVNLCTYANHTVNASTSSNFCSNATNMNTTTGITESNSTTTIGNNINTTGSSNTNNTFGYSTYIPFTITSDIKEDAGNGCGGLQGDFLLAAALFFVLMNLLS